MSCMSTLSPFSLSGLKIYGMYFLFVLDKLVNVFGNGPDPHSRLLTVTLLVGAMNPNDILAALLD